jgi:cytochrome c oxidase subunit 2
MIEYFGKLSQYLGLPINSASHGHQVDNMIGWVHWLMLVLFVGWGAYLIITIFKFKKGSNPKADYHGMKSHFSQYVEYGVIFFEAFLLIGLSIPLYAQLKTSLPNDNDVHHVRVIAQQFAWNMHYPGPDGKFGKTSIELVDEEMNPIGLDRSSKYGGDDIVSINQMHLPVNKQVMIHLSSKDVIHSFGIPEMRIKQDAIPGMTIPFFFTPNMTTTDFLEKIKGTAREGKGYEIACAQLCGNSHYRMRGYVTIDSESDYEAWLSEQAEYIEEEGDDDDW